MITAPDFNKKQIVFVFANDGEKMAFSNDNFVVRTADGKIKFQCTCYRLFLVYVIGNCSITSVLIQKAKKFGFFIAMMTGGFRLYALIGAEKDGNTLLKQKQYRFEGYKIARHITENKMQNQLSVLRSVRDKNEYTTEAIQAIETYISKIEKAENIHEIMGYEGLTSKLYFKSHFNNILWTGRQPRLKRDITNSVLDIGYTMLFTFVDALLESFGFDCFCGVLHTQFYMRKSLVCDIVEPFRPLIDKQVKKSLNLKQIKEEDFVILNHQYKLKYQKSPEYVQFLMKPIIENKDEIFLYIQNYYRAFMKDADISSYPVFQL